MDELTEITSKCTGHTLRYHNQGKKEWTIERSAQRIIYPLQQPQVEVGVTEIDAYFDDGFAWCSTLSCGYSYSGDSTNCRRLSTREAWEEVVSKLQELSVKTVKKFKVHYGAVVTTYYIPILGHEVYYNHATMDEFMGTTLAERRERDKRKPGWLKWNNTLYSPEFIYIYTGNEEHTMGVLRKLGPVDWKISTIPNSVCIAQGDYSTRKNWLEFDFGEFRYVSHIGTYGKYPQLANFPTRRRSTRKYWNRQNRLSGLPINGTVRILGKGEEELSWVTRYIVHYRDAVTSKWIQIGNDFNGNENAHTEKVNAVACYTRYLRITPLEHHYMRHMRVTVYGAAAAVHSIDADASSDVMNSAITGEKKSKGGIINTENTIQYTIYPPNMTHQRPSYSDCSYYDEWYHDNRDGRELNMKLLSKEGIQEHLFDWGCGSDDEWDDDDAFDALEDKQKRQLSLADFLNDSCWKPTNQPGDNTEISGPPAAAAAAAAASTEVNISSFEEFPPLLKPIRNHNFTLIGLQKKPSCDSLSVSESDSLVIVSSDSSGDSSIGEGESVEGDYVMY